MSQYKIVEDFVRPDPDVVAGLGQLSPSVISDSMGRYGCMQASIKPVSASFKIAGPAFTVQTFRADNLMCHLAIKLAKPGDVLVIDANGVPDAALWGELMSIMAQVKGIAGVVIDGAVRDPAEVVEMGFPVFTRAITPMGGFKVSPGSINVPIACGGVSVNPGDVIVGDASGVVVVPRDQAVEVLAVSEKTEAKEEALRKELASGTLLYDKLNLQRVLATFDIEWIKERK